MSRWKPGSESRLAEAALQLYAEQGFARTTAAELAARAGGTESTFFRYFTDKRDVLFAGFPSAAVLLAKTIRAAPPRTTPVQAVGAALEALATTMEVAPSVVRQRLKIVAGSQELQERDLSKLAGLAAEMAKALEARGVSTVRAHLTASAALVAWRTGLQIWNESGASKGLAAQIRKTMGELKKAMQS